MSENDNRRDDGTSATTGTGVEIALCLWFALTIVTFWGPYLGFLQPSLTTPLYSLFLIGAIAASALRILKGREATRRASAAAAALSINDGKGPAGRG